MAAAERLTSADNSPFKLVDLIAVSTRAEARVLSSGGQTSARVHSPEDCQTPVRRWTLPFACSGHPPSPRRSVFFAAG